jgi:5'-phosphate synthase pdxT subunit
VKIGVLALQGAVREHLRSLSRLGVEAAPIKEVSDLEGLDGLVFPGGESTAMTLLGGGNLLPRLRVLAREGFPMFGTCAGMILLSKEVEGQDEPAIGAIDLAIVRNASGRQVHSFETTLEVEGAGKDVPAVFIRAPSVTRLGPGVVPLAWHNGSVVVARQGNILVSSFHPELTDDLRIHRLFLDIVEKRKKETER